MEELASFHTRLNGAEVVPDEWYRRNHHEYPLVCYVNTIIGLCLSRRFDGVTTFIGRANRHMSERGERQDTAAYYGLVREYLSAITATVTAMEQSGDGPQA